MNRPPLEVADLIRMAGQKFIESSRSWLTAQHRKVLAAIARCRTAALGGHRDECSRCRPRAAPSPPTQKTQFKSHRVATRPRSNGFIESALDDRVEVRFIRGCALPIKH